MPYLGFRDTDAGIAYLDADLLTNLIDRSRDGDGSTHRRIFYGIGEQILEYQIHHRKIGREGMLSTGCQPKTDMFLLGRHLELIHLLTQEDRQLHILQVDLCLRYGYFLEIKQLGHHPQKLVAITQCHLQELSALIAQCSILRQVGKRCQHKTQRGTDVMSGIHKEVDLFIIVLAMQTLPVVIPAEIDDSTKDAEIDNPCPPRVPPWLGDMNAQGGFSQNASVAPTHCLNMQGVTARRQGGETSLLVGRRHTPLMVIPLQIILVLDVVLILVIDALEMHDESILAV